MSHSDEPGACSPDLSEKWRHSRIAQSLGQSQGDVEQPEGVKSEKTSLAKLLNRAQESGKRLSKRQSKLYQEKLLALAGPDMAKNLLPAQRNNAPTDSIDKQDLGLDLRASKGSGLHRGDSGLDGDNQLETSSFPSSASSGKENAQPCETNLSPKSSLDNFASGGPREPSGTASLSVATPKYAGSTRPGSGKRKKRFTMYDDETESPWNGRTRSSAKKIRPATKATSETVRELTPSFNEPENTGTSCLQEARSSERQDEKILTESESNTGSVRENGDKLQSEMRSVLRTNLKGLFHQQVEKDNSSMETAPRATLKPVTTPSVNTDTDAVGSLGHASGSQSVALSLFSTGKGSSIRVSSDSLKRVEYEFGQNVQGEGITLAEERTVRADGLEQRRYTTPFNTKLVSQSQSESKTQNSVVLDLFSTGKGSFIKVNSDTVDRAKALLAAPAERDQPVRRGNGGDQRAPGQKGIVPRLHSGIGVASSSTPIHSVRVGDITSECSEPQAVGSISRQNPVRQFRIPRPVMKTPANDQLQKPVAPFENLTSYDKSESKRKKQISAQKCRARLPPLRIEKNRLLSNDGAVVTRISTSNSLCVSFTPCFTGPPSNIMNEPCRFTLERLHQEIGKDWKHASLEWVANHYRWIVLRGACVERLRLHETVLTYEFVLSKLKARADREWSKGERSAIQRIVNADVTSRRSMIVFVSQIHSKPAKGPFVIEVSDGWYALECILDTQLAQRVYQGKVRIGQKILLSHCDLSTNPKEVGLEALQLECNRPLDRVPSSGQLRLVVTINCAKPAPWDAPLGFLAFSPTLHYGAFPREATVRLSHIRPFGGAVPRVQVLILRRSVPLYREELKNGGWTVRTEPEETVERTRHENAWQDRVNELRERFSQQRVFDNRVFEDVMAAEQQAFRRNVSCFVKLIVVDISLLREANCNQFIAQKVDNTTVQITIRKPDSSLLKRLTEGTVCVVTGLRAMGTAGALGVRLVAEPNRSIWTFPPVSPITWFNPRAFQIVDGSKSELDTVLIAVATNPDRLFALRFDGCNSIIAIEASSGRMLPTTLIPGTAFAVRDLAFVHYDTARDVFNCIAGESTMFLASNTKLTSDVRDAFLHLLPILEQARERVSGDIIATAASRVHALTSGLDARDADLNSNHSLMTRKRQMLHESSDASQGLNPVKQGGESTENISEVADGVLPLHHHQTIQHTNDPQTLVPTDVRMIRSSCDSEDGHQRATYNPGETVITQVLHAGSLVELGIGGSMLHQSPQPKSNSICTVPLVSPAQTNKMTFGVTSDALTHVMIGKKLVEARLNRGRFAQVQQGWILRLESGKQYQEVQVIAVRTHASFRKMLEVESFKRISPWCETSEQALAEFTRAFGSLDMANGVVAFEIRCRDIVPTAT